MHIFIDNKIIKHLIQTPNFSLNPCLKNLFDILETLHPAPELKFGWPSLLEALDLGALFENFYAFDQGQLFQLLTSSLASKAENDFLIRLYDQIFVECLTEIKALPEIDANFLIERIHFQRMHLANSSAAELFTAPFHHYEKLLKEQPAHVMHDLILYLAWDRVCVNLAQLFENETENADLHGGLEILQACLLESFEHITKNGRTAPGFFRMVEALYAYQMRESRLQIHSDADWLTLCQSSNALRPRETLNDIFYIDAAITHLQNNVEEIQDKKWDLKILTLDSPHKVKESLLLTRFMNEKIKLEVESWPYILQPVEIVCLDYAENQLNIREIIPHTSELPKFN